MPAETHQRGSSTDAANVLALIYSLLGDPAGRQTGAVTLDSLGVDAAGIFDLWDAVCEEFAERMIQPEMTVDDLDPSMTPLVAATIMARLLGSKDDHGIQRTIAGGRQEFRSDRGDVSALVQPRPGSTSSPTPQ